MTAAVSNRKRPLKGAIVAALIAFTALVWWSSKHQPTYQGRAVGSWFREFDAADGTSENAREALRALGARAVPYLVNELTNRSALREGYVSFASKAPRWMGGAMPNWRFPSWKRRESAAKALAEIGPTAKAAVPALIAALNQTETEFFSKRPVIGGVLWPTAGQSWDPKTRAAAAIALGKIAPDSEESVAALIETLRRTAPYNEKTKEAAAVVLANLGPEFKEQIPTMVENLKYQDQRQYRGGIETVVTHSQGTAGAVPMLIEALRDPRPAVREAAAYDLRTLRPNHRQAAVAALPALIATLNDNAPEVRISATETICAIAPQRSQEILPALIKLLGERDYTLRLRAIDLLRQLGPEAADAIPALSGRSDDDARVVRVWAGEALKRTDPEAPTNTSSGTSP